MLLPPLISDFANIMTLVRMHVRTLAALCDMQDLVLTLIIVAHFFQVCCVRLNLCPPLNIHYFQALLVMFVWVLMIIMIYRGLGVMVLCSLTSGDYCTLNMLSHGAIPIPMSLICTGSDRMRSV